MILVFTDLDGTLLDHETYSYAAAEPALKRLKESGIPLILASSKTEAEMRPLAQELALETPMIVENGAGVAGLEDSTSGQPCYEDIRALLDKIPPSIRGHFQGFGDWGAEKISARTGLPLASAERAGTRRFSEPGVWDGTDADFEIFETLLEESGFHAVRGGRFTTIMPQTSKGEAMAQIAALYMSPSGDTPTIIALGDGENDIAMLEAADYGIVIANPAHAPLPPLKGERDGKILRSELTGAAGWNKMLNELVDRLLAGSHA
ncbi:mannosyl-3-phosphoglycerate phosphatase [Rhizobium sp. L1K21]|uniref:HAD-IIB family hydrolase n=1 Tax=Rhizobium sp. L1K21 TaxID=2954933 RepID=UPI0020920E79|nr:HAD-IIB family hydrolase [Rhizobium sp. L1K21]MCO6186418.1 HAD-IIB family hydrolase [Rhizobium sp. L1K21]